MNFNALSRIPPVKRVKVNNDQLCPDETELLECVKLEMINKAIDSWEGFLRIYPHQYNIGNKIGFQFDRALTAFVVSKIFIEFFISKLQLYISE